MRKFKISLSDVIVLRLIEAGHRTGYSIWKVLESKDYEYSRVSVYYKLQSFTKRGWIIKESENRSQSKVQYQLTQKGREVLDRDVSSLERRHPDLVRLVTALLKTT